MSAVQQFLLDEVTKKVQINLDNTYPVLLVPDTGTNTMNVYYNAPGGTNMQLVSFPYMPIPFSVDIFDGAPPTGGTLGTKRKMKVGVGS